MEWMSRQRSLEYEVALHAHACSRAQPGGTFLDSATLAIPAKNVSNPHEAGSLFVTRLSPHVTWLFQ